MSVTTCQILDGKALAQKIQLGLGERIQTLKSPMGRPPGLAVLMVGDNPASAVYVRNKEKACTKIGMASFGRHFPTDTNELEVLAEIVRLNQDERVDGILIQLPLPKHLDAVSLLYQIDPKKDADGLHPLNLGGLVRGEALMLLEENATVTIAHSRTENLAEITRSADILVPAVGKANLITPDMVKPGAVVVDVGINRVADRLVGDVDYAGVLEVASYLTPVPGGVGPMTVAMLLKNTLLSYERKL